MLRRIYEGSRAFFVVRIMLLYRDCRLLSSPKELKMRLFRMPLGTILSSYYFGIGCDFRMMSTNFGIRKNIWSRELR
jgi:hypothetical protein